MISLGALLDPGFRQAASVLVEVGAPPRDIGETALLASRIEARLSRAEAGTAELVFDDRRGSDGAWTVADSGHFFPWQKIRISADFQTHVDEVFRGYVTELKPDYPPDGGESKLTVVCQDDSVALNREHMRTVWGTEQVPLTDRAILMQLIAPAGLNAAPGGDGQKARALTQDGTAIQFLQKRARANGYELIFARGEVYFGEMRLKHAPQKAMMLYAGKETTCLSFTATEDGQKPDAVAYEIAPRKEGDRAVTGTVTSELPLLGKVPATSAGRAGAPSVWKMGREGEETAEETVARARALADRNAFKIRATGELDGALYGHVLQVALPVEVDGAGARNGGLYYVDSVAHEFTEAGYRQSFELIRNATGSDEGLMPAGPLDKVASAISGLF